MEKNIGQKTKLFQKPVNNMVSYALLLLSAGIFLLVINFCILEDGGNPTPGYASSTSELYLFPSEVAVDMGETVDIQVRLDTRTNEVSAVDVFLLVDEGLTIMNITPNEDSFATFAPIDEGGVFDEAAAISRMKFGGVQYDSSSGEILEGIVGDNIVIATVKLRADSAGSLYLQLSKDSSATDESNVFVSNYIKSEDVLETSSSPVHILSDCTPSCVGKQCGSDGCLGTCGTCDEGRICEGYTCVRDLEEEGVPERELF